MTESSKEILFIHNGAIGDLILAEPAIRAVREKFEGCSASLLGNPSRGELLKKSGLVESVYDFHSPRFVPLYGEFDGLADHLKGFFCRFDQVVAWVSTVGNPMVDNLNRMLPGRVTTAEPFPSGGAQHCTDYLLDTVAPLEVSSTDAVPRISPDEDSVSAAAAWLNERELAPGWIAFHPGSGGGDKNWPLGRFSELAARLREHSSNPIVWISGPAETENLLSSIQEQDHVIQDLDLPVLAALLQSASLYVGCDSGISHLAAAVGTPTVVVFGPTDPKVWAPRPAEIVHSDDGWPSADRVFQAAQTFIL